MAETVQTLLAFPPDKKRLTTAKEYDSAITSHINAIKKLPPNVFSKTIDKKSILELLDPCLNSASYLYTLIHLLDASANAKDDVRLEHYRDLAYIFMASFDPVQVRYLGNEWVMLWERLFAHCTTTTPTSLIPMVAAMIRLDPTTGTFTTQHLHVVRTAVEMGIPSQALPILDQDIYAFPQTSIKNVPEDLLAEEHELSNAYITDKSKLSRKIAPENVLEYYLLGAHVYIGQRNWARARLFLEHVLLTPSQQHLASQLQVEAYRKWILIGLLSEGRQFPLPRTADAAVIKSIKALTKEYDALADDFEKRDYKKFVAEATEGENHWKQDGTHRMVQEASTALMRYRVIDLQRTYAALPVSRLASRIELDVENTLTLLADMISLGYLDASLSNNDANAVLRFASSSGESEFSPQQDLDAQTKHITALVAYIRDADRRLQLTKEYVDHQKRLQRTGGPDGDMADMMDLTWEDPIPDARRLDDDGDEDIMEV